MRRWHATRCAGRAGAHGALPRSAAWAGLALMASVAASAGCSDDEELDECDALAEYFLGTERSLPVTCGRDLDCEVVFVTPERPVATSGSVEGERLERARATWEQRCGDFRPVEGAPIALCEPLFRDQEVGDGTSVEVIVGTACMLAGEFTLPPVDPPSIEPPSPPCACERDADCGGGYTCVACGCYPATPCGNACAQAARCDATETFGFGATAPSCLSSCSAALRADPARYEPLVACLPSSPCDRLGRCLQGVTLDGAP